MVTENVLENRWQQFEKICQEKSAAECVVQWKTYFGRKETASAIDILLKYKSIEEAVSAMAAVYAEKRKELAFGLEGAASLCVRKKDIRTIGIFYYTIAGGGVQRVISLLIPMYLEMGYRVVLFTDEAEGEKEYPIPKQVERVLLPSALTLAFEDYGERAEKLSDAIQEYRIDVMLYHASECRTLLYDMLLVKAYGIPFCIAVHGLFSEEMLRQAYHIEEKLVTFRLADCLVVLSQTEKYFWNTLGIRAVCVLNPVEEIPYSDADGEYILWLGRLEKTSKQYVHAVDIMQRVVAAMPGARMKIVGNEVTLGAKAALKKRIRKLHLEDHVEICDFTLNVAEYYQNAQVFLVTSSGEAFSMTIAESKGYGIPLVTYDMPYLEILQRGGGYISVPQDDIEGAAEAILGLLKDKEKRQRMKREARESFEALRQSDLKTEWKQVLNSLLCPEKEQVQETKEQELANRILSTMLLHYKKGCMQNGIASEYAFVRFLNRLSRLYVVYRENGLRMTQKIIKRKLGGKKWNKKQNKR